MSSGIFLASKRVLAHVYSTQEIRNLGNEFIHGKGGNWTIWLQYSKKSGFLLYCFERMKTHRIFPAYAQALKDLSLPLALFGAALFCGMSLVALLIMPDRFPVHMGDSVVRVGDLTQEEQSLTTKQASLLEQRDKLLALAPTPVLRRVIALRDQSTVSRLARAMNAINAVQGESSVIDLTSVTFDGSAITMTGTVSDPQGQSIQLLARMTDALRRNSVFARVSEPEYQSIAQADGSTQSPFTIILTLQEHS